MSSGLFGKFYKREKLEDLGYGNTIYYVVQGNQAMAKKGTKKYFQLLAVNKGEYWSVFLYDANLDFVREELTDIQTREGIEQYIKRNYSLVTGLYGTVLHMTPDCSNKGISSYYNNLYMVSDDLIRDGLTISYLDNTLLIEPKDCVGSDDFFYYAKPLYKPNRWFMSGGNYITTSDSRFNFMYAIPIFDRVED